MNAIIHRILNEALALSADERSVLTVALIDSLDGSDDPSISDAWRREIAERLSALKAGTVKASPWTKAKSRLGAL
jgi:putative addiction module component (TIGR02574 family)